MMKEEEPIGQDPRDEQAYRVAYLIAGYIREDLTQAEHVELDNWVTASMDNQRLFEELTDEKNLDAWLKWKEKLSDSHALDRLKARLEFSPPHKKPLVRSVWLYAAAACILIIALSVFWMNQSGKTKPDNRGQSMAKDLAPGKNRAVLTLSDGTEIMLDSAKNGDLAFQNHVKINKQDSGQLSYQVAGPVIPQEKEIYNTLTIPAGGRFKLVLPDGTQVWLNSGSSLKYPVVFSGSKRQVILGGEAYFEVARDPVHAFEVKANGVLVEVLGTHFNVNAYADEPDSKVTLAEGSLNVNQGTVIKPGEQAQVNPSGSVRVVPADLEMELAWKNGLFLFKQVSLDELMRQVARWYDCDIRYEANITDHFNASISRDVPVSKLLHLLEETGRVHFKIENKKITIMK